MARSAVPPDGARCSIARSLEVLGERWTLLVIREAFRGRTRFAEFRDALGVATDVLTVRLRTLVEAGVLERRSYREPGSRERFSYHLTPAGYDLRLVLGALQQWGDTHRPTGHGPATLLRSAAGGAPVRVTFVDDAGAEVDVHEVVSHRGPGWDEAEIPGRSPAAVLEAAALEAAGLAARAGDAMDPVPAPVPGPVADPVAGPPRQGGAGQRVAASAG